jgi:Uma2 family endonuclease
MATVWQATVEDLYRVEGKAELVNGELVLMHAGGDWHGVAGGNIFISLHNYARQAGVGRAYGDNVGFLCDLPDRHSFSPDAAYYTGPRAGRKFLPVAPVFAVEVRSDEDFGPAAEVQLAEKRADYFAAGTMVVWDVDAFNGPTIRSYRSDRPEEPTVFRSSDLADAEPAVPGWRFAVAELLN